MLYWQYSLVRIEAAVKQIATYCITAYGILHYNAILCQEVIFSFECMEQIITGFPALEVDDPLLLPSPSLLAIRQPFRLRLHQNKHSSSVVIRELWLPNIDLCSETPGSRRLGMSQSYGDNKLSRAGSGQTRS